jgi:hypothetical protein
MVDVHWEPYGKYRVLRAGNWDLDPDGGEDTIASLKQDVVELTAAIAFLETEEAERSERAAKDQRAGYEHATASRAAAEVDRVTVNTTAARTLLDTIIRESRRFQVPYMKLYASAYDRRAGRDYATNGNFRD